MNSQESQSLQTLQALTQIIFNLNNENISQSAQATLEFAEPNLRYSFNLIVCHLVYSSFFSKSNDPNIYFLYLKEIDNSFNGIFDYFCQFLLAKTTEESNYLLESIINQNLVEPNLVDARQSLYFAHRKLASEISRFRYFPFGKEFFEHYNELSKDNWKLHKQYVHDGVNPLKIAQVIRNDDVDKLQEISSQTNFDFSQIIQPSLYERCSFINKIGSSLIDYCAFFVAIKCFKFLLLNGSNLKNTGKFAIAGGNPEIIHLCEQNGSSFEGAYETAIEFHRNDIFYYLYNNRIAEIEDVTVLSNKCVEFNNYEILMFLEEEGLEIDHNSVIIESAKMGNLFIVKHFLESYRAPKEILIEAAKSRNIELISFILGKDGIDINAKDALLFIHDTRFVNLMFLFSFWSML